MNHELYFSKMKTSLHNKDVKYVLKYNDIEIDFNSLIGNNLHIEFLGEIKCKKCGRITSKSFSQGFCYPCSRTAPENDVCTLHPQYCNAHNGFARDIVYAQDNCLKDHIVYFANSGGLKVGVTRISQMPTRWIDQGAEYALPIAVAPNRHIAGQIEVALKKHYSDKTNWRKMLQTMSDSSINLNEEREKVKQVFPNQYLEYYNTSYQQIEINYPISEYPTKITNFDFNKSNVLSGKLVGIKGQYLIFDNNIVLNVRKFTAYKILLVAN